MPGSLMGLEEADYVMFSKADRKAIVWRKEEEGTSRGTTNGRARRARGPANVVSVVSPPRPTVDRVSTAAGRKVSPGVVAKGV